jgi:CRP-like cAMP-binding protein
MASESKPIIYKADSVIFGEGEPANNLFIIKSGEVGVYKELKDRLVPIATLGPKSFLGELSVFDDSLRRSTAIATKQTEVIIVKKTDIKKVLGNCPDWVSSIMQTICIRLRNASELIREHNISDEEFSAAKISKELQKKYLELVRNRRMDI